ncbi:MAG TPA: enoyl-CoA hydratase/isomerase family protein [Ilumatobacter sp.]|nr:enoyl-CoA hydratase/isomerase family protein [Ilumatobacter sp.]
MRTITFQRPDVLNAFNRALCRAAAVAVQEAADESSVVVLRGAGGNFSVGGDIAEVQQLRADSPAAVATLFDAFAELLASVRAARTPVVAAVEGYALAGGFELLQVCDVVLVSASAVLGDHHIRAGQVPAGGGSQRLPRLVGRQRALAHLLTGERLDATTAVAWGLAYRSAPAERFEELVTTVVDQLASKDHVALGTMKSLVDRGLGLPLDEGLELERAAALDTASWREFG